MTSTLSLIRERRRALRTAFDLQGEFDALEESCVPSYCHPNPAAAGLAWLRLATAARLYRAAGAGEPILDFGAATGELFHLLGRPKAYEFVEANERLADFLVREIPGAMRRDLATLPTAHYGAIFALDSLEHNVEVAPLVESLVAALRPGGSLIVSGPTENRLYRFGRRLAGFSGHYHHITIYDIERALGAQLQRAALRNLPPLAPLFRLSVWVRPGSPTGTAALARC